MNRLHLVFTSCLLAATAGAAAAAPAPAPAPATAQAEIFLPGRWLRGGVGGGTTWVLVAADADAPRSLVELRWREARARVVSGGLAATLTEVVPPVGPGGPVLLQGSGAVMAVDGGGAVARLEVPGEVLGGRRRDDFASAPPWLAAARLGEARPLRVTGGGVEALPAQALPIEAERVSWGLSLTSPRLSFAGGWLVVGPRQEGRRVRTTLLGPAGERIETIGVLPEPEQISDSAVVELDGRPLLVLGTFRGLGLASKKRLRVFALDGRGGDAGGPPLVARELPARVWSDLYPRVADLDGDGREDLVLAVAEGFAGNELNFIVFAGRGEGRLAAQPVVAGGVDVKGASWRFGDVTGDGRPDLAALREGRLSLHVAGGENGLPGKRATATHALGSSGEPPRSRQVSVTVGSGGSKVEETTDEEAAAGADVEVRDGGNAPGEGAAAETGEKQEDTGSAGWDLLDLDGDGALEAVRWEPAPDGRTRVSVVGLATPRR
jgi:hypothetical protein